MIIDINIGGKSIMRKHKTYYLNLNKFTVFVFKAVLFVGAIGLLIYNAYEILRLLSYNCMY